MDPVLTYLIQIFAKHTDVFADMGCFPIDTKEFFDAFDGMGPTGSGKWSPDHIIDLARNNFGKYDFNLFKFDMEGKYDAAKGPWEFYINYRLKPEVQE